MSIWLKGYEYVHINMIINNKLSLDKEIYIMMFPKKKEKKILRNNVLIVQVKDNNEVLESKYINPKKKIDKLYNSLSIEDNTKINNFLNTYGLSILKYQLGLLTYKEIISILNNL